ncbi:MAG: hypothetical protein F4Y27_11340 [Acidimicrobiaceae bacterium]|nr:hypothetical protein [Acidimicrobiaceae bacterium]MXW76258.1 hypothetical protein [Acidimicrobiaceae bacterium]MYA75256.1 hypothetical protein [Acidimicrobiaceae bacterium]MYD07042.1 hypothetical protein [Acidimicrobiaceae bacterium]MYG56616.1 hypothetical protein [Acidimicrobiaceae bacterium]
MSELLKSVLIGADVLVALVLVAWIFDSFSVASIVIIVVVSLGAGCVRHWSSRRRAVKSDA